MIIHTPSGMVISQQELDWIRLQRIVGKLMTPPLALRFEARPFDEGVDPGFHIGDGK